MSDDLYTLTVSRTIEASPSQLFDAWTDPEKLAKWWGPADVTCSGAAVDLRVGGSYWIDNVLPDESVLRIEGVFEKIDRPNELVFSWSLGGSPSERVAIVFVAAGEATTVTITHERIATAASRDQHEAGWHGCLDGLASFVT